MILFMILSLILLFITTIAVLAISAGGAAFIVLFGDVIVCAFIIIWIIRLVTKRKK